MGYEVYTEHPESFDRRAQDFSAWSAWAPLHAPWTGVGISDMAKLLQAVCAAPGASAENACQVLDQGGLLQADEVAEILRLAGPAMNEKVREVFQRARQDRYPVRVVFSKGFGALAASAYLAKHGSA
jgi:hypothetical protein